MITNTLFYPKLCYKGEFTTEADDNSYFYFFSLRSLLLKQVPTDYSINCTEWIIQQINVSIHVQGPGQTDPCPLTSAQADPSVSYHGAVSIRHHFYVLNIEQFILLLYKQVIQKHIRNELLLISKSKTIKKKEKSKACLEDL